MNRNSKRLSILAVAFALAFSVALAGCGQQASSSAASDSASSESASAAASESASAASESASSASASSDVNEITFTMTVDATEAGKGMLYDGGGTVEKGVTVYQALVDTGLDLNVDSSSGSAYVSGIGDIIANDGKAGWMFTVNGEMPSVGADKLEIADGDAIEWKYYEDASKAM
ncbi:MAG: DUF4430 domain-containing protein [Eggerthellaceae bacterium]|nr:DUF4430 domain-containing protein [Eggerthellaceae bacterium]